MSKYSFGVDYIRLSNLYAREGPEFGFDGRWILV